MLRQKCHASVEIADLGGAIYYASFSLPVACSENRKLTWLQGISFDQSDRGTYPFKVLPRSNMQPFGQARSPCDRPLDWMTSPTDRHLAVYNAVALWGALWECIQMRHDILACSCISSAYQVVGRISNAGALIQLSLGCGWIQTTLRGAKRTVSAVALL